jgi:hypothetical protein
MQPKNIICRYKKLFGHEDGNQHSANRQNHLADILVFILLEWWINACRRLLWKFFRLHPQYSDCDSRTWNMCSGERNSVQTDGTAPSYVDAIECEGVTSGWTVLWPQSSLSFEVFSQEMGGPTAAHVGHTQHIVTTGHRVWLNAVPDQRWTRDMCSASDEND